MDYRFELESLSDGWYVVNMIGQEGNEKNVFARFCENLEEAQEFMNTHDAEKEVTKRIKNWERAIKEEDEMDDGKLHGVINGYIVEQRGNQTEWEEF